MLGQRFAYDFITVDRRRGWQSSQPTDTALTLSAADS
jgi:hypothetical protein